MKRTISKAISIVLVVSMLASLNIVAFAASVTGYKDVPTTHWAYDAIMEMTSREMFSGTAAPQNGIGVFSPDAPMTRAQFVAVLTRYLFPDELSRMSEGKVWYSNNYSLALMHGLLTPEELDNGDLEKNCSRQEMSMLLIRATYVANNEVATQLLPTAKIADYDTISSQYQSYVLQAFSLGLLAGVDSKGTFNPNGILSRAQAATVIYRLIDPSTRVNIAKDGNITYSWGNGITYEGAYADGEANGFGTMIFPNEGTYTGYFVNGKREGLGTFRWNVGDVYVGLWNSDKMCGKGTYTFSDGYAIRGTWENNRIVTEAIYMEPSTLQVETGARAYVVAKCEPQKITEFISWKSSNPSVVAVEGENNLGTLTAKSVGTATITAKTDGGKTTTCTVTVKNPPAQKVSLNYGDYNIDKGDSIKLKATVQPSNADISNVIWSSSDSKVASVSSSGYVSAKSEGTAIISAKFENGLVATCYINVFDELGELWDGTWSIYRANAYGTKSSSVSIGTCKIDTDSMTVSLSNSPFYGEVIDVDYNGDYMLEGSYSSGTYDYELTLSSIDESNIVLEVNTIYRSDYISETSTTSYYVLNR